LIVKKVFPYCSNYRFNVAVWKNPKNKHLFLIGRELYEKGKKGKPDFSRLFLIEMDSLQNIISEKIIWDSFLNNVIFEDPRAIIIDETNIIIGLTAVLRSKKGFDVYPSILRLGIEDLYDDFPPPFIVLNFGPGKNITPIDNNLFLFRPEGTEYSHSLIIFSTQSHVPKKIQKLDFPTDLPWAQWRIGTTTPPFWINDHEAIMIFHGITIDNMNRYVYSLGRARLSIIDNHYKVEAAIEPLLTPDIIRYNFKSIKVKELHPRLRRVLYACGGIIDSDNPDKLDLYINIGDTETYQFSISIKDLKSDLNFS